MTAEDKPLGDYVRLVSGNTPSKRNSEFWGGTLPWVSAKDMKEFWLNDTKDHLTESGMANASHIVPAGTVLMLVRGMTLHERVPICRVASDVAFNQDVKAVLPKAGINPRFIPYLLRGNHTHLHDRVDSAGHGTGRLNTPDILSLRVRVPDDSEQRWIADFGEALDGKIHNLRATNATLEAIAQALFKSWFVDFDPVHAKAEGRAPEGMDAATASLFPSEFEDSELGPVPKGWRVELIGDLMRIKGGKQLPREEFSEDGLNPVFGGAGEMGRSNKANAEGLVIVVGRVGAYCGQFFWHFGKAWVNNNASQIMVPDYVGLWAYWCLKHSDIDSIKKGAAQPFVSNSDIAKMSAVVPGGQLINKFNAICMRLHEGISFGRERMATLIDLRDTLLPRLISGKLRLPEARVLAEAEA